MLGFDWKLVVVEIRFVFEGYQKEHNRNNQFELLQTDNKIVLLFNIKTWVLVGACLLKGVYQDEFKPKEYGETVMRAWEGNLMKCQQ